MRVFARSTTGSVYRPQLDVRACAPCFVCARHTLADVRTYVKRMCSFADIRSFDRSTRACVCVGERVHVHQHLRARNTYNIIITYNNDIMSYNNVPLRGGMRVADAWRAKNGGRSHRAALSRVPVSCDIVVYHINPASRG